MSTYKSVGLYRVIIRELKTDGSRAKRGIWIWCASTTTNTTTTMEEPWETVFWRSEGGSRDAMGASRGNQHTCRRPKTSMAQKLDLKLTKIYDILHDNH